MQPAGLGRIPRGEQTWCLVYVARLNQLVERHESLLEERERHRRAGLRRRADRDRFTLGTVLVRCVVGRHTGIPPSSVVVDRTCDECGEPHGRARATGTGTEVSISHSGDVVAVAVTPGQPVGVDVEVVGDGDGDHDRLTEVVCTAAEAAYVRDPSGFYAYWTRKEAVLKALGIGLRRPLTEVIVTPPTVRPSLLRLGSEAPPACVMADIPIRRGYAAAVTVLTDGPVRFGVVDAALVLRPRT
jgi:4'-phosphopantetheinyl transferase